MAKDGFLDGKTKIPFFGIVAMVLIVAIVAVSLRTQVAGLFPESTITVRSSDSLTGNVVGDGSASFYGQREVPLVMKTRLRSSLHRNAEMVVFIVDTDSRTMRAALGELETTVTLSQRNDGAGLTANFELAGKGRRVDIIESKNMLVYSEPGINTLAAELKLVDIVTYDGSFEFKGVQYSISFVPSGEQLVVSGRATENIITLVGQGDKFAGTWFESRKGHPVTVDPSSRVAIFENMW